MDSTHSSYPPVDTTHAIQMPVPGSSNTPLPTTDTTHLRPHTHYVHTAAPPIHPHTHQQYTHTIRILRSAHVAHVTHIKGTIPCQTQQSLSGSHFIPTLSVCCLSRRRSPSCFSKLCLPKYPWREASQHFPTLQPYEDCVSGIDRVGTIETGTW